MFEWLIVSLFQLVIFFCLIKKWLMLEIVDNNVFKIMAMPNNLVLVCRFEDHDLVFCSLYMICEICVFW